MTRSDVILLVPWAAFALGLAVVVLRLRLSRRRRPEHELRDGGERR